MSFEDNPYKVGDSVVVQGIAQSPGEIRSIQSWESPGPLCLIRVGFTDPDIDIDYTFFTDDPWNMYFELEV